MLTTDQINYLHRLYWSKHWPIRKIEPLSESLMSGFGQHCHRDAPDGYF